MNKKGFTLIELLGVIIILGILAAIGTVSYYKYLDRAKSKSFVMAEKTLMNNAKNAYADCFSDSNNDFCKIYSEYDSGESIYITLGELIDYGYSDKIKNPYDTSSYCDINNSYVVVDDNGFVGNNRDISYQVCLICGEHKSDNVCDGVVDTDREDTNKEDTIKEDIITFTAKTAIYTGNPISANTATALSGTKITYTYYSSTDCSGTALSGAPTNAGNYSVKAVSAGNEIYSSGSKCVTHTIKKNSNAYLSSLSITGYSISPSFSALTEEYTVTTEAAKVTINATAESSLSLVTGTGSQNLVWGSNIKSVMVTAQDGTVKTYKITINNERPTVPVLSISNSDWSTSQTSVYVSTAGSALSGLSSYEYYASFASATPTNASISNGVESIGTVATGTTGIGAAAGKGFSSEGITYVWFRAVSNNGFRSVWVGPKIVKIDSDIPVITVTVSGKTATLKLSDGQGVVGYGVNQSTTTQPTYTSVSGTSVTKTWTATTAGTYVAWVKDVAGRTANYEFTITSSAFCSISPGQKYTFKYTGEVQTFTVPCEGTYKLEVWGAQGASGVGGVLDASGSITVKGAKGSYASGNIRLTKGEKLNIFVGSTDGYNGGGIAGGTVKKCVYDWGYCGGATSGNGGGSTDIRMSGSTTSNRIIVAGGGSGSGGEGGWNLTPAGVEGSIVESSNSSILTGSAGTAYCDGNSICYATGAGGGGYYGGLAGYTGTSYVDGSLTLTTIKTGERAGDGYAVITFMSGDVNDIGKEWVFDYSSSVQNFQVPLDGTYKLEVWGAQGGGASSPIGSCSLAGGKGGYSSGNKKLTAGTTVYIVTGGAGSAATLTHSTEKTYTVLNGGYNGGGSGASMTIPSAAGGVGGSGGGATHMALNQGAILSSTTKSNLLIVAGGGGGSHVDGGWPDYSVEGWQSTCWITTGGFGGGTTGGSGGIATGGTQSEGGSGTTCNSGSYGQGGNTATIAGMGAAGGGGGLYGGASGYYNHSTSALVSKAAAGGGSGYVGGVTDGQTISGNASVSTYDGTGTMTGNSGNGYAKITLISTGS